MNHTTLLDTVVTQLKQGESFFTFRKKNGEIRECHGTRNLDKVPTSDHPQGIKTPPSHIITFFDLDKSAWRSFDKTSLLSVENPG